MSGMVMMDDDDVTLISPSALMGCEFPKSSLEFPLRALTPKGENEEKKLCPEIPLSEFSFEGDHDALRANPDYLKLIRTLSVLQSQKVSLINDIEVLSQSKDKYSRNPLQLLKILKSGQQILPDVSAKMTVCPLPDIIWEKYRIDPADQAVGGNTRNAALIGTRQSRRRSSAAETKADIHTGAKVEKMENGSVLVRGRLFDEKKPKTFNQPWTPEEQKRLEELLLEYPTEEVEMERWKKIAFALGNRTAIQVQSRIQKYFLKLQKAGLPIPGRANNRAKRFFRNGKSAHPNSVKKTGNSFFPLHNGLKIEDDDEYPGSSGVSSEAGDEYFEDEEDEVSDEDVPETVKASNEYKELLWLKRIRREVETEQREGTISHLGFRCDGCNEEPILGTRWHCSECVETEVDFCNSCAPKEIEIGNYHFKSHKLKPVRRKKKNINFDRDYCSISKDNYLDPNFMK